MALLSVSLLWNFFEFGGDSDVIYCYDIGFSGAGSQFFLDGGSRIVPAACQRYFLAVAAAVQDNIGFAGSPVGDRKAEDGLYFDILCRAAGILYSGVEAPAVLETMVSAGAGSFSGSFSDRADQKAKTGAGNFLPGCGAGGRYLYPGGRRTYNND